MAVFLIGRFGRRLANVIPEAPIMVWFDKSKLGFTLVELIVVMAIVGVLVGLLFPAVQAARQAARRTVCTSNLHEIGKAIGQYESDRGFFPATGQTTEWRSNPPIPRFAASSFHARLVPYYSPDDPAPTLDLMTRYNASPANTKIAQTRFSTLICPTTPYRPEEIDREGFGVNDYAAVSFISISPVTGRYDPSRRTPGAFDLHRYTGRQQRSGRAKVPLGVRRNQIIDGTGETIGVVENAGRHAGMAPSPSDLLHLDPVTRGPRLSARWAEPATDSGIISGMGRQSGCPIERVNCTPRDEPYSFHPTGFFALYCDGHVEFLADGIDPFALRSLAVANDSPRR